MYLFEWVSIFFGVLGAWSLVDYARGLPAKANQKQPNEIEARQLLARAAAIITIMSASASTDNEEIPTWLRRTENASMAISALLEDAQRIFRSVDAPIAQVRPIQTWMADYEAWKEVTS